MRTLPLAVAAIVSFAVSAHALSLKTFTDPAVGFEIALPNDCRHIIGPGTIEAVCAPGFDAAKAKHLKAAGAWFFEIDFEVAPKDAKAYSMAEFRMEAPPMVCGEADAANVSIDTPQHIVDNGRTIFTARVTCPSLSFLGLPERTATARVVVAGERRFRLIARTPTADADRAAVAVEVFLASLKIQAP